MIFLISSYLLKEAQRANAKRKKLQRAKLVMASKKWREKRKATDRRSRIR